MKRTTRNISVASKRKRRRYKKCGKAKTKVRTKTVSKRFEGFTYEVLFNMKFDPTIALDMMKVMMPDVLIRQQNCRRGRFKRTSAFFRSEKELMLLKMMHSEIIYKVYHLVIQTLSKTDD